MEEKKISIIIPVYNSEKYIVKSLQSVLNQCSSKDSIEIICVNDGSKDNSKQIVEEFIKNHEDVDIKLINKENTGVSDTRNIGIEKSNGNYIMFLDSDDELKNNAVDKILKMIKSNFDIDVILFNFSYTKRNGKLKNRIIFEQNSSLISLDKICEESIRGTELNNVWQFAISREFILKNDIKFNSEYAIGEDLLFNLEMFSNHPKIYYLNKILYQYNYNSESVMRALDKDKVLYRIDQTISLYMHYFDYIKKWEVDNTKNRKYVSIKLIDRVQVELKNIVILNITYKEKRELLKKYFYDGRILKTEKYITAKNELRRGSKYVYEKNVSMYFIMTFIKEKIRRILKI